MNTKKITLLALFTAAALVLHLIESMLPPIFAFAPGAKLGLSNVVTLIAVFILGVPESYIILVIRCVLGSVFGGNIFALAYSLTAGVVALTVEIVLIKLCIGKISIVTISFIGAILHNIVQLLVAGIIVKVSLLSVLPLMLLASTVAGLGMGAIAYFTLRYLPKTVYILQKQQLGEEENEQVQQ